MAVCNWASVETCTTEPVAGRAGALQALVTGGWAARAVLGAEHAISPKRATPTIQRSTGFRLLREVQRNVDGKVMFEIALSRLPFEAVGVFILKTLEAVKNVQYRYLGKSVDTLQASPVPKNLCFQISLQRVYWQL